MSWFSQPAGSGVLAAVTLSVSVAVCVKLPAVPVTVMEKLPVEAVLLVTNVSALVAVAGFGLKEAVTPLGKPDADKVTLELKPFCGVIATVLESLAPCIIVRLLGDADRAKFGTARAVMLRLIVVEPERLPELPVTVTLVDPVVAVELADNVTVLLVVALGGLKDAVTPFGKPETDKLTAAEKPLAGMTVIVVVPLAP